MKSRSFTRGALNRMTSRAVNLNSSNISVETYGYDTMSRMTSIDRTEDAKRDVFGYNQLGEMITANYGTTGGINPLRPVSYTLDKVGN